MASPNRVILYSKTQRDYAKSIIDKAAEKCVMTIAQPTRTVLQNAKVWAMLTDISKQRLKPSGVKGTPNSWKGIIMEACGYEIEHEMGLDGEFFPVGHRSSELTIPQCADLIEFMYQFGAENGIQWKDEEIRKEAA